MAFTLDNVVLWGRSYGEYIAMFSLTKQDLGKRILGCGDGPASFNAELTERGGKIISIDPIYRFKEREIAARITASYDQVIAQTRKNRDEFVWRQIRSVEELGRIRMEAMNKFLKDYARKTDRYIAGELPALPFGNGEFDLALCSHFLFLYSRQFSLRFHLQSIMELCRIAAEARIFPLLELGAVKSRYLDDVILQLEEGGYTCRVETVAYEFQKGGNEMLRVKSPVD